MNMKFKYEYSVLLPDLRGPVPLAACGCKNIKSVLLARHI